MGCEAVKQTERRIIDGEEAEPCFEGYSTVYVGIPHVIILIGGKLFFDSRKPVLQDGELHRNAMIPPDALLFAHCAVGASADQLA